MLCPLTLCVLLVATATVGNCVVLMENDRPILWQQTASQLTDLPIHDGVRTPNPWHSPHRMSLFRLLIAVTDPFMGCMGTNATDSPMWGLPLHLGWAHMSGRLADPPNSQLPTHCGGQPADPMCISPQSWWACFNYYFSVIPFLSAAQQGFFGEGIQVQMQVPEGVGDYCTTYAACNATGSFPNLMAKWDAFYQGLKAENASTASDLKKKDRILSLFWAAHQASVHASAVCSTRQSAYSAPEVRFAESWKLSMEFIAATYFQSNIERSLMLMERLPGRVLQKGDIAPGIADLSSEENHFLSLGTWMNSMDSLLGGTLVRVWRSAMCSVDHRKTGRALLQQLLLNPDLDTTTFRSTITRMAANCLFPFIGK